jgi:cadmium resistance protein CadD (predicted permease)
VGGQLETVAAAMGVFVGTDIDDIIVLTVLLLSARATGKPRPWQIWAGQYAGIGVLVIVSAIAALGLTIVPDQWVGLLGLVPFALGVKSIVVAIRTRDQDQPPAPAVATGVLSVVGVTIANGADNISVYPPVSHHRPDQQPSHRGCVRRRNRRLVPSRVLVQFPQKDH